MSRRGAEFSDRVKENARQEWYRNNPHRQDQQLEIHHKCSIAYGKSRGVPNWLLKSQENAQALPIEEHNQEVHDEAIMEMFAQALLGLVQKMF